MKIFKGNYGWSLSAHSKTKEGKELKCYLDVQFGRQSEPPVEEIEGELVFITKGGKKLPAFFSSYERKGIVTPKLILMPENVKPEQKPLVRDDGRDMFGRKQDVVIEESELPFY